MKPTLHPLGTDFKLVEMFDCAEGVGLRILQGQHTVRLSNEAWRDLAADAAERLAAREALGAEGT